MTIPTGFAAYRLAIATVALDLGGGDDVKQAVARLFESRLNQIVSREAGERWTGSFQWWKATDKQLEDAAASVLGLMAGWAGSAPIDLEAYGKDGMKVTVREGAAFIEGPTYRLLVANITPPSGGPRDKWNAYINDSGKQAAGGYGSQHGVSSANSASETAAKKSVATLVEKFFKVKLEKPQ